MAHALAPSTRQMYATTWQKFKDFIENTLDQQATLPASINQIHLYVAHLHSLHYKHSTILTHLSAISHQHKMRKLPDPTAQYSTAKMLAGVMNLQDNKTDQRRPITIAILMGLLVALTGCTRTDYEAALYRSMYTLMYYACLRASEVIQTSTPRHNLTLAQIHLLPNHNAFKITFHSYKHSNHQQTVILVTSTTDRACPVAALRHYLTLRGNAPGPLFQLANQPITRQHFLKCLHNCLKYINIPSTNYNVHSFRIGRTTDMAQQNIPHSTIQKIGRWKSTAFLQYIRPSQVTTQPNTLPRSTPGHPL